MRYLLAILLLCGTCLASQPDLVIPSRSLVCKVDQSGAPFTCTYNFPIGVTFAAGQNIVVTQGYGVGTSGHITAVADNAGTPNTGSLVKAGTSSDGQALEKWIVHITNAGGNRVKVTFDTTYAYAPGEAHLYWNHLTTTSDGTCANGHTTNSTSWTCGSFTPTASGDVIDETCYQTGTAQASGAHAPFTFTAMASPAFSLVNLDNYGGIATQWLYQSTAAAVNPTITSSITNHSLCVGAAFKTDTNGPAAPTGLYIAGYGYYQASGGGTSGKEIYNPNSSTVTVQTPCVGCTTIYIGFQSNSISNSSAATMTNPTATATACTSKASPLSHVTVGICRFDNITGTSATTVTFHLSATPSATAAWSGPWWGFIGGATTSMDVDCSANSSNVAVPGTINNQPSCVTTAANDIIVGLIQQDSETVTAVSSSAGTAIGDFSLDGTYDSFNWLQDGGMMSVATTTAGTYGLNYTYSNIEGVGGTGDVASYAVAIKPASGATKTCTLTLLGAGPC